LTPSLWFFKLPIAGAENLCSLAINFTRVEFIFDYISNSQDFTMDDMMHDDSASEMDAKKHTYEVIEEFDMNGEPQMVGESIELTAEEAAPYAASLQLVADTDDEEDDDWGDEDDDEDEDDDKEEEDDEEL
jgi:hypothetical protein